MVSLIVQHENVLLSAHIPAQHALKQGGVTLNLLLLVDLGFNDRPARTILLGAGDNAH
jgi:hypothetical protein